MRLQWLSPQLRSGMGSLLPHDDAHPDRPTAQIQQAGNVRDPGPFADLPVAVIGRVHAWAGTAPIASAIASVMVMPTE